MSDQVTVTFSLSKGELRTYPVSAVDVRIVRYEKNDDVIEAFLGGIMESCPAVMVLQLRIPTVAKKIFAERGLTPLSRQDQQTLTVLEEVEEIDIGQEIFAVCLVEYC